jgi:hypothetical protein
MQMSKCEGKHFITHPWTLGPLDGQARGTLYLHEIVVAFRPHLGRAVVLRKGEVVGQSGAEGVVDVELRVLDYLLAHDGHGEPDFGVVGGPAGFVSTRRIKTRRDETARRRDGFEVCTSMSCAYSVRDPR